MTYRERSEWTKVKAADAHRFGADYVKGVAVHWNGPAVPRSAFTDPRSYLEGVRRFHVHGNGWSDIAYNLAVDQAGDVWELRGLRHMSAANGDTSVNARWVAVLAVIGQGQEPTPAMIRGLQDAVARVRRAYPRAGKVTTHAEIRPEPTACPGPDLKRAVARGHLEPPTPEDDDMPTTDELIKALLDQLRDTDSPLARNLRNNIRIAVQDELAQERAGQNPGQ